MSNNVETSVNVSGDGSYPIKVNTIRDAAGNDVDVQGIFILDVRGNPVQLLKEETGLEILNLLGRINAKLAKISDTLE